MDAQERTVERCKREGKEDDERRAEREVRGELPEFRLRDERDGVPDVVAAEE